MVLDSTRIPISPIVYMPIKEAIEEDYDDN